MRREELLDLNAFLTVAQERSFARAAARLGTSQSALSHTIRRLEASLGVRLLMRTTRAVAPTEAGERPLGTLGPALDSIAAELVALGDYRDKPAGTIRITSSEHAAATLLWPALERFLPNYPDIHVEISTDSSLTDIVAQRFDAGVRLGEALARDMIAVRIRPDLSLVVVGSPDYLRRYPAPRTPYDLAQHRCINQRMVTAGGLYAWELMHNGRELRVRVDGQLTFNSTALGITAALAGFGLAFVMKDLAEPHLRTGRLVQVLEDCSAPFPGFHLYYPSRRQPSPRRRTKRTAAWWRCWPASPRQRARPRRRWRSPGCWRSTPSSCRTPARAGWNA